MSGLCVGNHGKQNGSYYLGVIEGTALPQQPQCSLRECVFQRTGQKTKGMTAVMQAGLFQTTVWCSGLTTQALEQAFNLYYSTFNNLPSSLSDLL